MSGVNRWITWAFAAVLIASTILLTWLAITASVQRRAAYTYQPSTKLHRKVNASANIATKPYEPACFNPQNAEDAGLCGQWAAVDQAVEANRLSSLNIKLATSSLLSAIVGTLLVVLTLSENRRTSYRQLRAYMVVKQIFREKKIDLDFGDGDADYLRVQVIFENTGQTPAIDVGVAIGFSVLPPGQETFSDKNIDHGTYVVGNGHTTQTREMFLPVEHLWLCYSGEMDVFLKVMCRYRDTVSSHSRHLVAYHRLLVKIDPAHHFRNDQFLEGVQFQHVDGKTRYA